jgi:hypothetical protein
VCSGYFDGNLAVCGRIAQEYRWLNVVVVCGNSTTNCWRINIGEPGSLENKQVAYKCNNTILLKFICGISILKGPYRKGRSASGFTVLAYLTL